MQDIHLRPEASKRSSSSPECRSRTELSAGVSWDPLPLPGSEVEWFSCCKIIMLACSCATFDAAVTPFD